jgi:adenylate kinase family enzyme
MRLVMIIGCAGAGKSTLARDVHAATGLPLVHLDANFWQAGWREPPEEAWAARVAQLAAAPAWVMDGNYGGTMALRIERADTIVFLDYPRHLCLARLARRVATWRGRTRPDTAPGCPEILPDWAFLRWIWRYRKVNRPGILNQLAAARAAGKRVWCFTSPAETAAWLARLRASAHSLRRGRQADKLAHHVEVEVREFLEAHATATDRDPAAPVPVQLGEITLRRADAEVEARVVFWAGQTDAAPLALASIGILVVKFSIPEHDGLQVGREGGRGRPDEVMQGLHDLAAADRQGGEVIRRS